MDSVHRHMAIAKEKETVSHEEYINTAFLHCNCYEGDSERDESTEEQLQSLQSFFRPSTPAYIYTFYSRSISNRYGSLFSAVAMDPDTLLLVTVRPTYGNEKGQPLSHLPPCALRAICMVRMWRMKHYLPEFAQHVVIKRFVSFQHRPYRLDLFRCDIEPCPRFHLLSFVV